MKTYRVISFTAQFKGGVLGTKGESIERQLQDILNQQAAEGWAFKGMESTHYMITPGCLASLTGQGARQGSYDVLVFEK